VKAGLVELLETDLVGVLPEEAPTDHEVVLPDDTVVGVADSAASGAFAVLPGVGVPDVLVGHVFCLFFDLFRK